MVKSRAVRRRTAVSSGIPAIPELSITTSKPSSSPSRLIRCAFQTRTGAVVSMRQRAGTIPFVYASSMATMMSTSSALKSRAAAAAWGSSSTSPAWTTSPKRERRFAISCAAAVAGPRMCPVLL